MCILLVIFTYIYQDARFRECQVSGYSIPLKMGPIGYPETSIRNCRYLLCNSPEEHSSHPLRGGSLKSGKVLFCCAIYTTLNSLLFTKCLPEINSAVVSRVTCSIAIYRTGDRGTCGIAILPRKPAVPENQHKRISLWRAIRLRGRKILTTNLVGRNANSKG